MTVSVTAERMDRALALLMTRAARGQCAPSNDELAKAIGMGAQKNQPIERMRGWRHKSHEGGAVVIQALEFRGLISVERGSFWRRITLTKTGQVLEPRPRALPAWAA